MLECREQPRETQMPVLKTLVNFNSSTGFAPQAGLVADAAGDLFGTTDLGPNGGAGTVFEIAKTAGSHTRQFTTF
jgi:hypothetical protein